uniref:Cre-fkh-6 protein n=1 Tax=Melanopsichium pennsylvanicum 4 TaxID=1398559 RepID=A0A077QS68_9BASI|nr:cre-fkh-6 protein [Melanopsichium pennsylvanicum 4]
MYLSHPRDLISSMSSGCSRNTALLPHPDHLAQLLSPKSDWHTPNRQSTKVPAACSSPVSDQAYTRLSDSSSISTSYAHNRMERTTLCLDYNKTGGIPRAVSSSHTHSVSRLFRSQHFRKVWEELDAGNPNVRPQHPYTELIKLCILKRPEGKLTLNQLYRDLEDKFPFFDASANGKGWKVSTLYKL